MGQLPHGSAESIGMAKVDISYTGFLTQQKRNYCSQRRNSRKKRIGSLWIDIYLYCYWGQYQLTGFCFKVHGI